MHEWNNNKNTWLLFSLISLFFVKQIKKLYFNLIYSDINDLN